MWFKCWMENKHFYLAACLSLCCHRPSASFLSPQKSFPLSILILKCSHVFILPTASISIHCMCAGLYALYLHPSLLQPWWTIYLRYKYTNTIEALQNYMPIFSCCCCYLWWWWCCCCRCTLARYPLSFSTISTLSGMCLWVYCSAINPRLILVSIWHYNVLNYQLGVDGWERMAIKFPIY